VSISAETGRPPAYVEMLIDAQREFKRVGNDLGQLITGIVPAADLLRLGLTGRIDQRLTRLTLLIDLTQSLGRIETGYLSQQSAHFDSERRR
jgi:hypothetical protein